METELQAGQRKIPDEQPLPPEAREDGKRGEESSARADDRVAMEELASLFGVSSEEIRAALATLGSGQEKGLETLRTLSPACVAIKGRFEARKRGEVSGGFCVVASGHSGEIRDQAIWVGTIDLPQGFSIDASWESVRNALLSIAVFPDRLMLHKVEAVLGPLLAPTAVNLLFRSPEGVTGFAARLKEILSNQFRVEVVVDVRVERFNQMRMEMGLPRKREERPVPEEKEDEEKNQEERSEQKHEPRDLRIACSPILDPVHGIPVNRLHVGNVLDISFEKSEGFGKLIGRLVSQMGKDAAFPISSLHTLPTGNYAVEISISDDVIGVMNIPPTYRVRLHQKGGEKNGVRAFSIGLFFEGLLFFLAVFLLALLLMYNFLR